MSTAPWQGRRVLVFGAAGFIGRWVARMLSAAGADLTLAVRDMAVGADILQAWSVRGPVVSCDVESPDAVRALVTRVRPAVVFNLAGYGVDPRERDEATATRLNTDLPPLLAAAMAAGHDAGWSGQHVVHTGSALEYGTAAGDLAEDTVCTPTTLYGRTKLAGTERLHAEARRLKVRAVTARLFTVYGAGEHDGRLLPSLIAATRTADALDLTPGLQERDFTAVEDAAEGLLRLGALPAPDLGVVNVATGTLTTVRAFAESAAQVLGIAPARLRFGALPTRPEEMHHDPVSVAKLRRLTGWVPSTTIAEGVKRAAAFVKQRQAV